MCLSLIDELGYVSECRFIYEIFCMTVYKITRFCRLIMMFFSLLSNCIRSLRS